VSDDTFTESGAACAAAAAAAAAVEVSDESEAASVNKPNSHSSAALLTTEILDILQGYEGSLGHLLQL